MNRVRTEQSQLKTSGNRVVRGHGLGRIFSGNAVVEIPDAFHVGFDVAGWVDGRAYSTGLASIVKKAKDNRNPCAAGDVVEARFPADDAFARSGRCNG